MVERFGAPEWARRKRTKAPHRSAGPSSSAAGDGAGFAAGSVAMADVSVPSTIPAPMHDAW
jgi:hypothetical protein